MPITLSAIANRTKALALPFEGDTINLTYRPGKITEAWKAKMQGIGTGNTQTDDTAMAFLDASLVDLLASWDVLVDDGGAAMPLTSDTFAQFDLGFKMTLLLAVIGDSTPGEANGATSKPSSAVTLPTTAK